MNPEDRATYKKAIEKWGEELQLLMLFEEIGELQKAVSKFYRGKPEVHDNLVEEIADVRIMLEQLEIMAVIKPGAVDRIKAEKMERLKKMLEVN